MKNMIDMAQKLYEQRMLNAVELFFGEMVARRSLVKDEPERSALELLAAAALNAVNHGHSCLVLNKWQEQICGRLNERREAATEKAKTEMATELEALSQAVQDWVALCGTLPVTAVARENGTPAACPAPLIAVQAEGETRVYLNRFRVYEYTVAQQLNDLLRMPPLSAVPTTDEVRQSCAYFREFQADDENPQDLQLTAVCDSLQRPLSVITGGPGTGKTTVLAVILAWELRRQPDLNIALCAPTGKAAARMRESILDAVAHSIAFADGPLSGQAIDRKLIELHPSTVHSLLKISPDTGVPRYHAENPLASDLVVVDECSMVSLEMFSLLLAAMKKGARLLLLGDKDQLTSVEAGNVMAEICCCLPPDRVSRLQKNQRSRSNPQLCSFVRHIIEKTEDFTDHDLDGLYGKKPQPKFRALEAPEKDQADWLKQQVMTALTEAGILPADSGQTDDAKPANDGEPESDDGTNDKMQDKVKTAYERTEKCKILCAVREGRFGITQLNAMVRVLLKKKAPYANEVPIMVTKNDDVTGLRNGDVGVCLRGQVWFPRLEEKDGVMKTTFDAYRPAQLPPHETAYAMTIHKSQGSGYENVLMVLPDKETPVLTRELIYTGITRTKKAFTLLGPRSLVVKALNSPTVRWSGLQKLLEQQAAEIR